MELLFAAPGLHHPRAQSSSSSSTSAIAAKPAAEIATLLGDVVAALEDATFAAKRLSSASAAAAVDTSTAILALASLRNAHEVIGSFLAQLDHRPPSIADGDEPMPDGAVAEEDEATEQGGGSRAIEEVEEKMRDCGLSSKRRRKRLVPSSWSMGRLGDKGDQLADPIDRRHAIELVFQFHA